MSTDEKRALIAPCGLYCGECPLYLAHIDDSLRNKIAENQGIPAEDVFVCKGCRAMKGIIAISSGETACETYTCAMNDKKVEFCYECADFPCLKLAPCADRTQELPHNTKVYNLVLLQKNGIDSFIEKYRERIRQYRRGKKPRPGGDIQV